MTRTEPESGSGVQLGGQLAEEYVIESHLLATRSADAYRALDRARGRPLCLWMLRHPLAKKSRAVERFVERMRAFGSVNPAPVEVLRCGIDAAGVAFAVVPSLDGHAVVGGNLEVHEAERRFVSCVRLIERLHASGLVCGDLCGHSFWVDRNGDVRFVGLMGSFDAEAVATAMMPPRDAIPFLAPEQRSGGGIEPATDVFALGVLGHLLFTGRYPFGEGPAALAGVVDPAQLAPVASYVAAPPAWVDEVLAGCLAPDPAARFPNAGAIARAISEVTRRIQAAERAPTRKRTEGPLTAAPLPGSGATVPVHAEVFAPAAAPAPSPVARLGGRISPMRIALIALLVGVVSVLTVQWLAYQKQVRGGGRDELAIHREAVTNPELRQAIDIIGQSQGALAEQAAQLEKFVNSDDLIAHDFLVTSAKSAKNDELRLLSERAALDRARRLGLMRSTEQVRQWLRGVKGGVLPAVYEPVLRLLDPMVPVDASAGLLRQTYAADPTFALKLGAALAIDTGRLDEYQPVLGQLVGDALKIEDPTPRAALSLILASEPLALLFSDDVIQRREQIPDADIVWLLKVLADRNDSNLRAIANLAIERSTLPPIPTTFLTLVRDRPELPVETLSALIRAAAGTLRSEDVGAFGRWYDVDAERVLLSLCALDMVPELLQEIFDTLAGKSLTIEPSAALVEWVRRNAWDNRLVFARPIGILGNVEAFSEADLEGALVALERASAGSDLVDVLLEATHPRIARLVVKRYAGKLGLGGLINLLGNPDKEVRLTAIRALKDYNDIGALKFIIDAYERERDPEVRAVYRDNFWVIAQREAKSDTARGVPTGRP